MIIDMSQAAVNKTAMYHISHHVYEVLAPIRTGCQFFGEIFRTIPDTSSRDRLQREAFSALLPDPEGFWAKRRKTIASRRSGSMLYLDPLYVLFGGLSSADTVFVLDLSTVTTPSWHGSSVSRAYDLAFDLICTERPNVIAISQNTADTLFANYGFPQERTHVLPLYVPRHLEGEDEIAPFPSPEPYVLFVGSLESRKNLTGAVASFALSGLGERGYRFVIAGGSGHGHEEIARVAASTRNVFVTGYVTNETLRALYRGASAFIYPSYLEGFGVPLLEALHFGVPAVASSTGACPEVGGRLVRYLDPDDHVGFARELVRLVQLGDAERDAYAAAAKTWIDETFSIARFDAQLRRTFGLAG